MSTSTGEDVRPTGNYSHVEDSPTARRYADNFGPSCRHCKKTEARCAYVDGCCGTCSHWNRYDAEGNERAQGVGRPKRDDIRCGSEQGYHAHRYRREPACFACLRAHTTYNQQRAS